MSQPDPRNPYAIYRTDIDHETYLFPEDATAEKPKVAIIGGSKVCIPKDLKYVDESVMAEILEHVLLEIERPESPLGQSIINLVKELDNAPTST